MGVFNLSQSTDEESAGKEKAQDASVTNAGADALGNDTEKSMVKQNATDALTPEQNKTGGENAVADKAEQTIVLDGPLSHIYTQALNLAYANEGTSTVASFLEARHSSLVGTDDDEENRVKSGNSVTADGTYVYCVDSTDLDNQGLLVSTEALRIAVESKKYKNVVLALESAHVVTSKVQLLGEMGTALGAKVCLSRKNAVQTLIAGLGKA